MCTLQWGSKVKSSTDDITARKRLPYIQLQPGIRWKTKVSDIFNWWPHYVIKMKTISIYAVLSGNLFAVYTYLSALFIIFKLRSNPMKWFLLQGFLWSDLFISLNGFILKVKLCHFIFPLLACIWIIKSQRFLIGTGSHNHSWKGEIKCVFSVC